jgi:hypothetical protein
VASRAKGVARRQTIITAVLLIVGALLALALFAAGALWRDKSSAPLRAIRIRSLLPRPEAMLALQGMRDKTNSL